MCTSSEGKPPFLDEGIAICYDVSQREGRPIAVNVTLHVDGTAPAAFTATSSAPERVASSMSSATPEQENRSSRWLCVSCGWQNRPAYTACGGGNAKFGCGRPQAAALPMSPKDRHALKSELRKIDVSKDSYVEPELRKCDAQGFMAAGVLLWRWDHQDGVNILMAQERRTAGGPPLLGFIGGKRDALAESARQTAAREATEETGGLLSKHTRSAVLTARGPVLWDSNGKYATFVVEAAATDADLSDRLSERGGLPDPWDLWLLGVRWIALRDLLSKKWCKANMATHHHHPLRLLWPHLRALQKSATGITAKPRSPLLSSPSSSRSSSSSPPLSDDGSDEYRAACHVADPEP